MRMLVLRPFVYLSIAFTTQLVLLAAGLVALLPTGLLVQLPWVQLATLFAYNLVVSTLVAALMSNASSASATAAVKSTGLVVGHLIGLALGAYLGSKYGGALWAVAGGVALFFVAGRLGAKISLGLGSGLQAIMPTQPETAEAKLVRLAQRRQRSGLIYGQVIPGLLLVAAMLGTGWYIGLRADIRPGSTTIITILSVLSVLIPWLR